MLDIDLLDGIKKKDPDAFLELTERYGWSVYSAIREKIKDNALADQVYNETMTVFCHTISNSQTEDSIDAMLCGFARLISEKHLKPSLTGNTTGLSEEVVPPVIHLADQQSFTSDARPVSKKHGFGHTLCICLILIAIAAVLWGIAGLLMDMRFLPYYDLGYSWFHANILQLF